MEKVIERKLRQEVENLGGMCLKFESPGCNGVPDRIIIMPGGRIYFAETKDSGKKERPLQRYIQQRLREMGCTVFSHVDSPAAVQSLLAEIGGGSDADL